MQNALFGFLVLSIVGAALCAVSALLAVFGVGEWSAHQRIVAIGFALSAVTFLVSSGLYLGWVWSLRSRLPPAVADALPSRGFGRIAPWKSLVQSSQFDPAFARVAGRIRQWRFVAVFVGVALVLGWVALSGPLFAKGGDETRRNSSLAFLVLSLLWSAQVFAFAAIVRNVGALRATRVTGASLGGPR